MTCNNKATECNHCDHNQGAFHHNAGSTTSYICCRCGRTRQEHVPPPYAQRKMYEHVPVKDIHGPYVPCDIIKY